VKQTDALINRAIDLMRTARRIVALTGAGVSTPSGIPDYRSPKEGLWMKAADMMEVATLQGFCRHPQAFYDWLRPLLDVILRAQPNAAHHALAQLEHAGRLQALITQNIDLLHGRAGSRALYEVHGHLREVVCPTCHFIAPAETYIEEFLSDGRLPRCRRCRHFMKPSVILFGELLPWQTMRAAQHHARTADLFIVAGSSLEVAPAGELPGLALAHGARLIIVNLSPTNMDGEADVVIHGDVVDVLPRLVEPFLPRPFLLDPPPAPPAGLIAGKNAPPGDVKMGGAG
jgi:NAD-dependent deacetylase